MTLRVRFCLLGILLSVGAGQSVPFQVGEHLEYTAQFNFIPAGKAFLQVISIDTINGIPTYHVRFKANTGAMADRIYKIRDRIDSWLDTSNLVTHKQTKKISEGKYKRRFETMIDYTKSYAVTNGDTIAITAPVRDPYTLFYYLRTIPLLLNEPMNFIAFDNNVLTNFQVMVTDKETILVPAGTFPCLLVKPYREGKTLFKNQGDMQIWFSDDTRRLPVQIQIKLKYGSMVLKLMHFQL